MNITDILIQSHIVSEGELTHKQVEMLMKILEENTQFEEIISMLETSGHEVFHKHSNSLNIGRFNSLEVNEDSEDFLQSLEGLVEQFKEQDKQQPNKQKIKN